MTNHRIPIIAAAAILAVTATSFAATRPGSSAAAARPATLALVAVEQECGGADLPPADGSPGDINMCRASLHRAGRTVGRGAWFCPFTGSESAGAVCTAVASLHGGDIELAGRLNLKGATSRWAVTGGTGRYAGARGTATLRQLSGTKTALSIRLL